MLLAKPPLFQLWVNGWVFPSASIAREHNTCLPGVASQRADHPCHAYRPIGGSRAATAQVAQLSALNSARAIPTPPRLQARPVTRLRPASATRVREPDFLPVEQVGLGEPGRSVEIELHREQGTGRWRDLRSVALHGGARWAGRVLTRLGDGAIGQAIALIHAVNR